jgi:hypothetical protein
LTRPRTLESRLTRRHVRELERPSGWIRAPTDVVATEPTRRLEASTIPPVIASPVEVRAIPETLPVAMRDSAKLTLLTSCDAGTGTSAKSGGFGVPGKYVVAYPGMSAAPV